MCGLAELVLPPEGLVASVPEITPPAAAVGATPSQGNSSNAAQPADPIVPPEDEERTEEGEQDASPPAGRGQTPPGGAPQEEGAEEQEGAERGTALGGTAGVSPVDTPEQHYYITVPRPAPVSLRQILEATYSAVTNRTPKTRSEAQQVLAALESLVVPQYLHNVADPQTESTSYLLLASGQTVQFAYEDGAPVQDFIANLMSYAATEEEASQWRDDAISTWTNLLGSGSSAQRARRETDHQRPPATPAAPAALPSLSFNSAGLRIFIYCDLIQSALCSDFKGRCLRIVTAGAQPSPQILFPVYYYACDKQVVQVVHVELKDKHGNYVNFRPSSQPTLVVLHFRRVA